MDSAEFQNLRQGSLMQGAHVEEHKWAIQGANESLQDLTTHVAKLRAWVD